LFLKFNSYANVNVNLPVPGTLPLQRSGVVSNAPSGTSSMPGARPYSAAPARVGSAHAPLARATSAAPRIATTTSAAPRLTSVISAPHVPAPHPLPKQLTPSMQQIMGQITFKAPPPRMRSDFRATPVHHIVVQGAAQGVPQGGQGLQPHPAARSAKPEPARRDATGWARPGSAPGGPHSHASNQATVAQDRAGESIRQSDEPRRGKKIEHGIGPDLEYYVWEPPASQPDGNGRRPGVHPGRPNGSLHAPTPEEGERNHLLRKQLGVPAAPPYGDRYPRRVTGDVTATGLFERMLPHEAYDRLAGVGGTTLPSAENLTAIRDAFYEAEAEYKEEMRIERQAAALRKRQAAEHNRKMNLPSGIARSKFAWGSERISNALLSKFDTFTARNEDYTRKLLWTFGTDEVLTGGTSQIRITPTNMPRVCDRFGIACTEAQAAEIFEKHRLPLEGCTVQQLTSAFIEAKIDYAKIARNQSIRLHGDAARPPPLRETASAPPVAPTWPPKSQAAQAHSHPPQSSFSGAENVRPRTPLEPRRPHQYAHMLEAAQKPPPVAASAPAPPARPPAPAPHSYPAVRPASAGIPYAGMFGGTRVAAAGAAAAVRLG